GAPWLAELDAARRHEADLRGHITRLEAEVERLRETLARARVFVWELEPSGDWLRAEHRGGDAWRITRDGDEVAVVTGQEEALDRARQIAEEEDPQGASPRCRRSTAPTPVSTTRTGGPKTTSPATAPGRPTSLRGSSPPTGAASRST